MKIAKTLTPLNCCPLLLLFAVCHGHDDHHRIRPRSVSSLFPSIFGDPAPMTARAPPHRSPYPPVWLVHPANGLGQRPIPRIVIPAPTTADSIPDDLKALARRLGVRDLTTLPSLDDLTRLLGMKSTQEAVELIRSLARTADGLEMIRGFMADMQADGGTVNRSESFDENSVETPSPIQYPTFSRFASTLDSAVTDLNLLSQVLAGPPTERGFFARLAAWLGYSQAEDNNETANLVEVATERPLLRNLAQPILVNPHRFGPFVPIGYPRIVPRIGGYSAPPYYNQRPRSPAGQALSFVEQLPGDPVEGAASEQVMSRLQAPKVSAFRGSQQVATGRRDAETGFASGGGLRMPQTSVPGPRSPVRQTATTAHTVAENFYEHAEDDDDAVETGASEQVISRVEMPKLSEFSRRQEMVPGPRGPISQTMAASQDADSSGDHAKDSAVETGASELPTSGRQASMPQRVAGVNEEAYANGRIYKADLSAINIPIVTGDHYADK